MIPAGFAYAAPSTTEAVLALLAERPDEVKLMAGGQSLIPLLRLRLACPDILVDLRRLTELRAVDDLGHAFRVGAMVTHRDIIDSEAARAWQIVHDGGADLADPLVRNRGTFGGSIAHADPAGDWPPIALALNATMHVRGLHGTRTVAADEFFTDLFTTAIDEGELLTHIEFATPAAGDRSAYVKIPHPASGYAVAGAAVVVSVVDGVCRGARIVLTGVATGPVRARAVEDALLGQEITTGVLARAAGWAAEGIGFIGDSYAPEEYRRNLAGVAVRRALQRAVSPHVPDHHQREHRG
jgi:carbon-monoxide dehydrogenase medium subunit